MSSPNRSRRPDRDTVLPLGLVALPPLVWFTHLSIAYWLVPVSCEGGSTVPLFVVTAVAVLVGLAVVVVADRLRHRRTSASAGLLLRGAVAFGAYFTGVVLVTTAIFVVVDPCA